MRRYSPIDISKTTLQMSGTASPGRFSFHLILSGAVVGSISALNWCEKFSIYMCSIEFRGEKHAFISNSNLYSVSSYYNKLSSSHQLIAALIVNFLKRYFLLYIVDLKIVQDTLWISLCRLYIKGVSLSRRLLLLKEQLDFERDAMN